MAAPPLLAALLFGSASLIYYGVTVAWWAPIVLIGIGLLSFIPLVFVDGIIPVGIINLLGFLMLPLFGVLMVYFLPRVRYRTTNSSVRTATPSPSVAHLGRSGTNETGI
jgi:hypothetical protein